MKECIGRIRRALPARKFGVSRVQWIDREDAYDRSGGGMCALPKLVPYRCYLIGGACRFSRHRELRIGERGNMTEL
jgi:hypothetical protein